MKLARIEDKGKPVGWVHYCPGCKSPHGIYVEEPHPKTKAKWKFDGNEASPTFEPSIHCYTTNGHWDKNPPHEWIEGEKKTTTCHYFLRKGMIQFLDDCRHALKGQTVPLPDYPTP